MIWVVVIGFAGLFLALHRISQQLRQVAEILIKTHGRTVDADQRQSRRLYDLTYALRDIEDRLYDVHYAVGPFLFDEFKGNGMARTVRATIENDREKRIRWPEEPDAVLPSESEPSR